MKKNRKALFVLVIPRFDDLGNSFYAGEVSRGVNIAASRLDVNILTHFTDRKDHSRWLDGLADPDMVDGILFADIDRDWDVARRAIRAGLWTMVLNNPTEDPFNCISIDNRMAARDAVAYLLSLGHKTVAHVAGDLDTQAGRDRLEGYYDALDVAGIARDKGLVKKGGFLRTPARTAAKALLTGDKRPTAVFAASDLMALEIMDVAKGLGIKVPEELSVIGFDNNMSTVHPDLKLTTFEQPIMDMARLGLESLFLMGQGKAQLPVKMSLKAKMIKGRTTKQL